jgi:hypothetical protein
MSLANPAVPSPDAICAQLQEQTLKACLVAKAAAGIVAEASPPGSPLCSMV